MFFTIPAAMFGFFFFLQHCSRKRHMMKSHQWIIFSSCGSEFRAEGRSAGPAWWGRVNGQRQSGDRPAIKIRSPRRQKKRRQDDKTFQRKGWFPFQSVRFTKSSEGTCCQMKGSGSQRVFDSRNKNTEKVGILYFDRFLKQIWCGLCQNVPTRTKNSRRIHCCDGYYINNS